jgi:hypothetical protein
MPSVLLFSSCARGRAPFAYYLDWFEALRTHPGFDVAVVDTSTRASLVRGLVRARRRAWDLVVYPYGTYYDNTSNWRRAIFALAGPLRGTKVFFLENEYRLLRHKLAFALALEADYVTTQLPKDAADRVYGPIFLPPRIIPLPHGLATPAATTETADDARDIDLAFRGSSFPYYLGHRDRELLVRYFSENAGRLGLRVDLAESTALDRTAWLRYLRRCRGVLGHESGTEYLELNDVTRERVGDYMRTNPGASFEEIARLFFKDYPGPVSGRCVSSRHFEAIAAGACQILLPGRYNDILRADEHYLALARDFSNVDDVLARFRDVGERRRMVERTRDHVLSGHPLRHRVAAMAAWIGL